MRDFHYATGSLIIALSAAITWMAFTRRGIRARQVATARAGFVVRVALLTAAVGLWDLTAQWAFLVVWLAIIAWELTVQATALVRRPRQSAGG